MGSSTEHSAYGPTHNPWDLDRIPGGSGGGSAAAVAAFEAPLALGSRHRRLDPPARRRHRHGRRQAHLRRRRAATARSRSPPASTRSARSRRTVLDAALLHDVIGGHDPHDSTSLTDAWPSFADAAREGARGDVAEGPAGRRHHRARRRRLPARRRGSASARRSRSLEAPAPRSSRSAPRTSSTAIAAYYLILPAEASSNLAKFDSVRFGLRVDPRRRRTVEEVMAATREAGFGPEVKRRIILGTYALSAGYYDAYYGSAQKVRTLIQRDFDAAFDAGRRARRRRRAPTTAFKLGEKIDDPLAMYLNDVTTIPANLAGVPGMSLPIGPRAGGRPARRPPVHGARPRGRPPVPRRRAPRGAARGGVGRADRWRQAPHRLRADAPHRPCPASEPSPTEGPADGG